MPATNFDVIVIGAGASGLSALLELDRARVKVLCVEARERIGGRIFTLHDPLSPVPIELGAEFIHGRPPEIWNIVRSSALGVYDCVDDSVRVKGGQIQTQENAWEPVGQIMQDMQKAAESGTDEPFTDFLSRADSSAEAKELTASFVEGFNAARKEIIGIASLAKDARAADAIGGDRSFRFFCGYDSVVHNIVRKVSDSAGALSLNSVVTHVAWQPGLVTLSVRSTLTGRVEKLTASRLVVTVPLGVVQAGQDAAGSIGWDPVPATLLDAVAKLAFGQVFRVVLCFKDSFWEANPAFSNAGFILSNEHLFPTWWTTLAVRAPVLTGWSAGPHADDLIGQPESAIIQEAVASLARITGTDPARLSSLLQHAYFHDWQADPYARGAYSYVPAGALAAREILAQPVADTLFFAGEATELNGHSATVHGAIASGRRAARQILALDSNKLKS